MTPDKCRDVLGLVKEAGDQHVDLRQREIDQVLDLTEQAITQMAQSELLAGEDPLLAVLPTLLEAVTGADPT